MAKPSAPTVVRLAPPRRPAGRPEALSVTRVGALGGIDVIQARFVKLATPQHTHQELEIGVVSSGTRLVRCRGTEYIVPAGSIVVFQPGEVHSGAPLDRSGSTYRGFLISSQALADACVLAVELLEQTTWCESPVVRDAALYRQLIRAHRALAGGKTSGAAANELLGVVGTLLERHRRRTPTFPRRVAAHRAVAAVQEYLEAHYPSRIRLETLAQLSGLSVFYLIRVFRAATGLSPYAYLEQVRIHRASELLRQGVRVSEVAWRTGFADQSHLTRMFKRLVGVPPGGYQRSALRNCQARAAS